jgi:hypothetical protein
VVRAARIENRRKSDATRGPSFGSERGAIAMEPETI